MAQVFEDGEYHESTEEETLPIHKQYLTGCVVGKNAKDIFYEIKGVVEDMARYNHMEEIYFTHDEKPSWADVNAYLNIKLGSEEIGSLGLVSVYTMSESKIKRTNVAMFEINVDKLVPLDSRTNEFKHLPQFPLVEKDLSILVDDDVKWEDITKVIKSKVKSIEFIEEYRGNQVPIGKKSITLRVKIGNEDSTMTSDEINTKMNNIMKTLSNQCKAVLREE